MDARKALTTKRERLVLSRKSAVSTGSTLLNLACTDHPECGFIQGTYYYLVGDSTSGKTWISLTCFAEACINKHFQDYDLIFDDVEGGALMNIEQYFGKEVAQKMKAPAYDAQGNALYSDTVESFYFNLRNLFKRGRKFIYVLDSQDALDSVSSRKKFDKQKAAAESDQEAKGSYGDGKAKYHSENIRWVMSSLKRSGSILIIIGQTRDNLGFGFEKKTRAGGKALKFYATIEIWTSVGKKIKRKIRGLDRSVGVRCLAEARKNRVTGKTGRDRTVEIPIYHSFGIDDVGGCVDYLIFNKHWPRLKSPAGDKSYKAIGLDFTGSRKDIITYIEKTGLESKLREVTAELWQTIERECSLQGRKKRYL